MSAFTCPSGERPLSAQSDDGAPVESCQELPAPDGVKSPARLATSSGGLVIVHDRQWGEPARTSRSAQGATLAGTGPRSLPVVVVGYANDAGARRSQRMRRIAFRRKPTEPRRRPRHVPTGPNTPATPLHIPAPPDPPTPHHHQQSISTTIRLLHTCGIRGYTGVADAGNGGFDCRWRRETRVNSQANSGGVQRQ